MSLSISTRGKFFFLIFGFLLGGAGLQAQSGINYDWHAGDGFWDEDSNWWPESAGTAPPPWPRGWHPKISHDDDQDRRITFRQGGLGQPHSEVLLFSLSIGNSGSGNTTLGLSEHDDYLPEVVEILEIPPHEISVVNYWLGHGGDARMEMTGGQLNISNQFVIGRSAGPYGNSGLNPHHGQFELSGGDVFMSIEGQGGLGLFDVGGESSGTVIQSGGHVHAQGNGDQIRIGTTWLQSNQDVRRGRYELSGGQIDAWHMKIGQGFRGEFIQSGGFNNTFNLQVGDRHQNNERTATGYYELSGGRLETLGFFTSVNTNGEFLQTGGSHKTRSLFVYGDYDLRDGTIEIDSQGDKRIKVFGDFTQSGGQIDLKTGNNDALVIADGGVYEMSGGTVSGGGLEIGGSFYQTGGSVDLSSQTLWVTPTGGWTWLGGSLTGNMERVIVDGAAVQTVPSAFLLNVDVGETVGSTGHYTVAEAGGLLSGTIDLGLAGKGTLDVQTSGTVSVLNLNVGQVAGGEGVAIVRSGVLDGAAVKVGENGTGLVDVRGGELKATVRLDIGNGGALRQSGGRVTTPVAVLDGLVEIEGGKFNATTRLEVANGGEISAMGDFRLDTVAPFIQSDGSVNTPELRLNGGSITANTFTATGGVLHVVGGDNRIDAATRLGDAEMTVDGLLRFAGQTAFNGAFIEGTGSLINEGVMTTDFASIDQAFTNTGDLFLNRGDVTDNVSVFFSDRFTQTESGRLVMSVLDPFSLTTHDTINFGALAELAGTLELVSQNGFDPVAGTSVQLFNFKVEFLPGSGLTNLISGRFDELIFPDLDEGLEWNADDLYTYGTLSISASAVPEPASATMLFGMMALGLVATRRRRRRD